MVSQVVTRGLLNTGPISQPGGFIPDDDFKREFIMYMDALEPRETEFLNMIGKGEAIDHEPFYFGRRSRIPLHTTLAGSLNTSATAVPAKTGTGTIFQRNNVIKVSRRLAGGQIDPLNSEKMLVIDEPNGDTLTVVRGYGGTTKISFSDGAVIEVISVANAQNQPYALSPVNRGTKQWNRFQRIVVGVGADKRARNMRTLTATGDQFTEDFEEVASRGKVFLQRAILEGGETVEDYAIPLAPSMKGVRDFITTNVVNYAGNPLTYDAFESLVRDLWYSVGSNAAGTTFLGSMNTMALIDRQLNALRQANLTDGDINYVTNTLTTRTGKYTFKQLRDFPEGEIWLIDPAKIKYHPFAGMDWTIAERNGDDHGDPTDKKFMLGDFSLSVADEAAMARIHNFSVDPDAYPTFASAGQLTFANG